jgi:hypothetical protein
MYCSVSMHVTLLGSRDAAVPEPAILLLGQHFLLSRTDTEMLSTDPETGFSRDREMTLRRHENR